MTEAKVKDDLMNITGYTVDKLEDPFGLLSGDRYEFHLDIEVDEDDDLFSEKGIGLKVIYVINGTEAKILQYHFYEKGTEKIFDFSLEEDEEEMVITFCKQHTDGVL
ncbi:DUF6509 family protein [Neobacillus sp. PS3-34]|uniref:DUF6509 family protein n=1 Tax=Neobacillus sp. PS3-34 TaxID=3070678 RepID=UPI0027E05C6F|nr:DUF6509 family protein [Neobacillus sp. PS3-34]WML47894.1 DUF6509 family protein [Neobacillus sp. PS3-34]